MPPILPTLSLHHHDTDIGALQALSRLLVERLSRPLTGELWLAARGAFRTSDTLECGEGDGGCCANIAASGMKSL